MDDEILTLKEFAAKARVSRQTLVKMIKDGKICCFRTSDTSKGQYRIKASELDRPISWELHKRSMEKK